MPGFINKSISFNSDNELHMKALEWAEKQGISKLARELIIKAYLEKEGRK